MESLSLKNFELFLYMRRKVKLYCFLLTRQVYSQKGLSCRSAVRDCADKNGGSVKVKTFTVLEQTTQLTHKRSYEGSQSLSMR